MVEIGQGCATVCRGIKNGGREKYAAATVATETTIGAGVTNVTGTVAMCDATMMRHLLLHLHRTGRSSVINSPRLQQ